jgi:hypothetical protein
MEEPSEVRGMSIYLEFELIFHPLPRRIRKILNLLFKKILIT